MCYVNSNNNSLGVRQATDREGTAREKSLSRRGRSLHLWAETSCGEEVCASPCGEEVRATSCGKEVGALSCAEEVRAPCVVGRSARSPVARMPARSWARGSAREEASALSYGEEVCPDRGPPRGPRSP